jgi:hypothetical protein
MSLSQIMDDHAVAMTIVRSVAQAQWSDMYGTHLVSRDVVEVAKLLLDEMARRTADQQPVIRGSDET